MKLGPEIANSKRNVTTSNNAIITRVYDFIFDSFVDSVYSGFGGLYNQKKIVPKKKQQQQKTKTKKQHQQKIILEPIHKGDNLK